MYHSRLSFTVYNSYSLRLFRGGEMAVLITFLYVTNMSTTCCGENDIAKREQGLEEISRLLNRELPSIGYISHSVTNIGETYKNN